MGLKEYIIEKSNEIGIDVIGFTDCDFSSKLKNYLLKRQQEGYETEFEEKNIEKRINPKNVFSNCKTIIVIGISYNVDFSENIDSKLKGRISKSSWGVDYHKVVKDKMEQLTSEINKKIDFNYLCFTDTGSLVDRELAKKSGIGWYGKNCSIINDKYGSFIFIGYILTDLKIEKDDEILSKCGNCDLCLKACPTGALESPYKINPKKCISYFTQTKTKIPYELRNKMGIKVYGCDTCQIVCPKNKNVLKSNHDEFIPLSTKGYIDIEELFDMSNKEFKEKYAHMAGSWRGKNVLKRNCLIALGNLKDKTYIRLIKKALKDQSSIVREYAAWALIKIDFKLGKEEIKKYIKQEKNNDVKKEMLNIVKYFDYK